MEVYKRGGRTWSKLQEEKLAAWRDQKAQNKALLCVAQPCSNIDEGTKAPHLYEKQGCTTKSFDSGTRNSQALFQTLPFPQQ